MPEFRLPEATLIDIKRISKDCQSKLSARINYSRLFDKKDYYFPKNFNGFSCPNMHVSYCLTRNIGFSILGEKSFYCTKIEGTSKYLMMNNQNRYLGIRPVFKYSEIKVYCKITEEIEPGYLIVTFGEYPRKIIYDNNNPFQEKQADSDFWKNQEPILTGNKYTLININHYEKGKKEYPEVSFDGDEGRFVLKDGKFYEVEPVYFLVDIKKDFAISRDIMFFLPTLKDAREVSSYKETLPYLFLNDYFVPELMRDIIKEHEQECIETEENPVIKGLIDSILQLIKNTCIENIVKKELQNLIDEYNNDLEKEKNEKEDIGLTLIVPETPESKFIKKLQSLYSKIESFSYYKESKIIYSCLNIEKELDIDSELYKDIATILNYILPTLPKDLRKEYQEQIREILEYAKVLINDSYQTQNKEQINIELKVRARLQPLLEKLQKDVATNYITINLNEIINGLFKTSSDLYQAHLFDAINSIIKEIEILIESNKLEKYRITLTEILNNEDINNENYLINLFVKLTKLKNKIAEELNKSEKLERKKIKRKYF